MSFGNELDSISIKDDIDDINDISRTDDNPEDNIESLYSDEDDEVISTIADMELITEESVKNELDYYNDRLSTKYESIYPFCEEKEIKKSADMINDIMKSKYDKTTDNKDNNTEEESLYDFTKEDLTSDNGCFKYMDIYNKRMKDLYKKDLDSRTSAIKLSITNSYHDVDNTNKEDSNARS